MSKSRSRGVTIFGYILIVCSVYQMVVLATAGYQHYAFLHQEYSKDVILLRYLISWAVKGLGLIAGIGVLKLSDFFRKLAIFNSLLIIMTVHLKHTFAAYSLHMKNLDVAFGTLPYGVTFASLTWPALITQRMIDVIFGLALIYFFTRPRIKEQFKV